jgi:hypothetical protein
MDNYYKKASAMQKFGQMNGDPKMNGVLPLNNTFQNGTQGAEYANFLQAGAQLTENIQEEQQI